MMKRIGMALATASLVLLLGMAPAAAQNPVHKLGRGVSNMLTCWIEIPRNFHLGAQEDNIVKGALWGLVKGFGLAATRLGVGAYEAVSFPIPYPMGYASPYEAMELPDYPWQ